MKTILLQDIYIKGFNLGLLMILHISKALYLSYYSFNLLFRIHRYIVFTFCKTAKEVEGVFHCVLLIWGAKFGVPRNVSLRLYVHAAVAGEQKESGALRGQASWQPRLMARLAGALSVNK